MSQEKDKIVLIGWGLAGVYCNGYRDPNQTFSITTYCYPDLFFQELKNGRYQKYDLSDTAVVDKEKVLEVNSGLVLASPMINPRMSGNTIHKWEGVIEGTFHDAKGFDFVSREIYLDWWRDKGARVGWLNKNMEVDWESL